MSASEAICHNNISILEAIIASAARDGEVVKL
jgi:hypothetical protein